MLGNSIPKMPRGAVLLVLLSLWVCGADALQLLLRALDDRAHPVQCATVDLARAQAAASEIQDCLAAQLGDDAPQQLGYRLDADAPVVYGGRIVRVRAPQGRGGLTCARARTRT